MERMFALISFLLIILQGVSAQESTENYVCTHTKLSDTQEIVKTDFFDGLGRKVESVRTGYTPLGGDLVTLQDYDLKGREENVWLPTPFGNTGRMVEKSAFVNRAKAFYGRDGELEQPYSQKTYESSPSDRVLRAYGAGKAWYRDGKYVRTAYLTTTTSLKCLKYKVEMSGTAVRCTGYSSPGEFDVIQLKDEDGAVSYQFKDIFGHIVLERRMLGNKSVDTYYVYDDRGNIAFVLPPAAADKLKGIDVLYDMLTNTSLNQYAYYYQYDSKNRCITKKLPGCACVYMRYDKSDKLVFEQDGNQRKRNEWTFHLYDNLCYRPTVTGICKGPVPDDVNQNATSTRLNTGSLGGYSTQLSLDSAQLLTVNYYDDYGFLEMEQTDVAAGLAGSLLAGYDSVYTEVMSAHGLLTGQRIYQLDSSGKYTVKAIYYGDRDRIVQVHATSHIGGMEHEYYAYSFTGKVTKKKLRHETSSDNKEEYYRYSYDHADRLKTVSFRLDSPRVLPMATYNYDELGRVKEKILGMGSDTVRYDYNVRSWPVSICSKSFSERLLYNDEAYMDVELATDQRRYNGNIAMSIWEANGQEGSSGYRYHYDSLNRLTQADYSDGYALSNNIDKYSELYTYDKMGNILTLTRHGDNDVTGGGLVDALSMDYDGNRLVKVSDTVEGPYLSSVMHFQDNADEEVEYEYDANGNITKDLNRGITKIEYNLLNLPRKVTFSDGKTVHYLYSATGEKLQVSYGSAGQASSGGKISLSLISLTRNYVGNVIYTERTGTGIAPVPEAIILTDEGYVTYRLSDTGYYYFLRDHLGSVRAVLDFNGAVKQVNDYYPSGVSFPQSASTISNSYKFCGKELDRMDGLDWYDSEARFLDVTAGVRFTTPDPKAWDYPEVSPYAYCMNNPVNAVDPDGEKHICMRPLYLELQKDYQSRLTLF